MLGRGSQELAGCGRLDCAQLRKDPSCQLLDQAQVIGPSEPYDDVLRAGLTKAAEAIDDLIR